MVYCMTVISLLQVIVLALLFMASVTEQQQRLGEPPSDFEDNRCKEELNTLLINTSQRKHMLKCKRTQIREYIILLKAEYEEARTLRSEVQNLTTQIQEMKDTCTGFVPQDCCQVYQFYMWSAFIY